MSAQGLTASAALVRSDFGRRVASSDCMELLRLHIPLTLLWDLADATGPHSRELFDNSWAEWAAS